MVTSKSVVMVGLGLLLAGGAAMFWVLPSTGGSEAPAASIAAGRGAAEGAPGFDGAATVSTPSAAQPLQLAPDAVAAPTTASAAAPAALVPEKPTAPVAITGRVIDEAGRPVKGAAVAFFDDATLLMFPRDESRKRIEQAPHTETGADGRFALTGSVPLNREAGQTDIFFDMRSRLTIRHDAFATLVHSCGDVAPGQLDVGDLQLEPGAWIVGRVVDTAGRPVADADVSARNSDGGGGRGGGRRNRNGPGGMFGGGFGSTLDAFTTGSDGRFSVHGLRPGTADLTARKTGLRLGSVADVALEARVPRDVGDVVLETGESISGVVLDKAGAALAGAEVSVSSMTRVMVNRIEDLPRAQIGQEFGQRAMTDSAGHFEVGGLGGGTYNIHVRADGYASLDREDIPAGTANLRLQPVRLGGLLLTILDSQTGNAVEAAKIKATPAASEGPGRFFMPEEPLPVIAGTEALAAAGTSAGVLPPAAAAYFVRNAGIDGTDLVIAATNYATQEIQAPAVASEQVVPFVVKLVPDSLVAGIVIDAKKQPIDGATVTLRKVQPEDDVDSGLRGRIERRVVLGGDDDGPQISADSMSARTGVDGRFELRGAAAGEWTVAATAPDRVPSSPQRITLQEGRPQPDLSIMLATAGSIAGLVTEADGTPAADVQVVVEPRASAQPAGDASPDQQIARQMAQLFGNRDGSSDGPRMVRTDADGAYLVSNLAEGEYGVKIASGPRRGRNFGGAMVITLDGDGNAPRDDSAVWAKVVPGTESRVNLVRPRRGVVTGTVLAGGKPAAGVSVSLRPQEMGFFGGERADTDDRGAFRFEDVEAGSYTVSAQAAGAAMPERAPVAIEAGQEGHASLVFSGSTVSGRVMDTTTNAPVAGVLIHVEPVQDVPAGGEGEPQGGFEMITMSGGPGGGRGGMSMTVGGGRSESARSDDKGNFTLNYLKPGKYTIEASGSGYQRSTAGPIEVLEDQNKSDVLVGVTRGGVVEGVVVSGSTGDRLDKVPVRIESENEQSMTVTENGAYRFEGLSPGDYTVNVLGSGFDSDPIASEKVQIDKDGEVHKLDLTTKQS